MRRLLAAGLGCSLAWLATAASADDHGGLLQALLKRSAAPRPAAPTVLATPAAAPGIVLGRPQVLPDYPEPQRLPLAPGSGVVLTSFQTAPPRAVSAAAIAPQPISASDVRLAAPPTGGSDFASDTPGFTDLSSSFGVDAAYAPPRRIVHSGAVMAMAGQPVAAAATVTPPGAGPAAAAPLPGLPTEVAGPMLVHGDGFDGEVVDTNGGAPPMSRLYMQAEYLLWWIRSPQYPPLVTTGPPASLGILGAPGTSVLFGGTQDYGAFSGGRVTLGYWLDPCQQYGIEGSFFMLGQKSINFAANSNQFPVLARPIFEINTGMEVTQLTAFPGLATGSIAVNSPSQLWGADLNMRGDLCCGCCSRWSWLAGVRVLALDENVTIRENVMVDPGVDPATLPPGVLPGDHALVVDSFSTHNRFFGGQVGLDWERRWGNWQLDVRMKVALGDNQESININGFQFVTHPNGTTQTFAGGLLALPSNIGHFERNRVSVVPELGINLGYHVTDALTVYVGYNFLYWSNVVRPGDQIDRVVDVNQIPNFNLVPAPAAPQLRPVVPFKETGFWAQGFNAGLEYRY